MDAPTSDFLHVGSLAELKDEGAAAWCMAATHRFW